MLQNYIYFKKQTNFYYNTGIYIYIFTIILILFIFKKNVHLCTKIIELCFAQSRKMYIMLFQSIYVNLFCEIIKTDQFIS